MQLNSEVIFTAIFQFNHSVYPGKYLDTFIAEFAPFPKLSLLVAAPLNMMAGTQVDIPKIQIILKLVCYL